MASGFVRQQGSDSDTERENDSDDGFYHQPTTRGYLFEPSYTEEEYAALQASREPEQAPAEERDRLTGTFWCDCDECVVMPKRKECICCHEWAAAKWTLDEIDTVGDQKKCITHHPDMDAHLNKSVLHTYFRSHRYNWKKAPKPKGPGKTLTNGQLRLVSYRIMVDWVMKGKKLGKKKRIVLPACVAKKIRATFPADDGVYVGFRMADLDRIL